MFFFFFQSSFFADWGLIQNRFVCNWVQFGFILRSFWWVLGGMLGGFGWSSGRAPGVFFGRIWVAWLWPFGWYLGMIFGRPGHHFYVFSEILVSFSYMHRYFSFMKLTLLLQRIMRMHSQIAKPAQHKHSKYTNIQNMSNV